MKNKLLVLLIFFVILLSLSGCGKYGGVGPGPSPFSGYVIVKSV